MSRPVGAPTDVNASIGDVVVPTQGGSAYGNHNDTNRGTVKKHFTRRFISFVGNNMDYVGYKIEKIEAPPFAATLDDGWQFIPYHSPVPAFNVAKWQAGVTDAEAFRIGNMGFEITDICPMSTETKTVGTSTEIQSNFQPEIILEVMIDPEGDTDSTRLNAHGDNVLKFEHNSQFMRDRPANQADGQLPKVKFGFTKEFNDCLQKNYPTKADDAYMGPSTFQDYPIFKYSKGQRIRHTHKGFTDWFPLGAMNRANPAYANPSGTKLKTTANQWFSSDANDPFGLTNVTPFVGMLQATGATVINQQGLYRPKPVYIRAYYYMGKDGAMDVTVQFEIKYFYTIEFKSRRVGSYPFCLYDNPPANWADRTGAAKRVADQLGYSMSCPNEVKIPFIYFDPTKSGGSGPTGLDYYDGRIPMYVPQPSTVLGGEDSDYMNIPDTNSNHSFRDIGREQYLRDRDRAAAECTQPKQFKPYFEKR